MLSQVFAVERRCVFQLSKRFARPSERQSTMRQKLLEERKRSLTEYEHLQAFLDEESEMLKHISPIDPEEAQKHSKDFVPFVKTQHEPASDQVGQSPERSRQWDEQNKFSEHRDRPVISDAVKTEIIAKHLKYPGVFSHQYLAKSYGLSADEIYTLIFEHEMKNKFKMFTPNEQAKFKEEADGDDKKMEKQAFLMNAYSEILSEKGSKWMPHGPRTDIEYQESHQAPHEYYTKKILKNTRSPFIKAEEAHVTPKEGPGSGQQIPCESWQYSQTLGFPYLITDVTENRKSDYRPNEVKVRERNGTLRWSNLDELNWVKFKEMHPKTKHYKRTKNITAKTRLLFKGILEPLSYHYRRVNQDVAHSKMSRWHHWWGEY